MAENEYDLIVIGAGGAGSTAASSAAKMGKHVALIERDKLGGTCLNYGCDPTKTLLHTAHLLYHAQHASNLGLEFLINPENDHITHLVMREGHLWGQKDITIPMSQIDHFADNTVYLKLNKQQIEELPTIPVQHNRVISDKTMM